MYTPFYLSLHCTGDDLLISNSDWRNVNKDSGQCVRSYKSLTEIWVLRPWNAICSFSNNVCLNPCFRGRRGERRRRRGRDREGKGQEGEVAIGNLYHLTTHQKKIQITSTCIL